MSDEAQEQQEVRPTRRPPRAHGPGMAMGLPGDKAMDFRGSLKRALGYLRAERLRMILVAILAVISVALSVVAPKILGKATNVIFEGMFSKNMDPAMTKEQVIAGLRAKGDTKLADMLSGMNLTPGHGIDFDKLGQILLVVIAIYLGSFLFGWIQARTTAILVQNSIFNMRAKIAAKLNRLPLSYFDKQPRGEILSRVTNDIDNVSQTLTQVLSQLITAVLTIVGVLAMMFWISPLLAVIALVTVPLSIIITVLIAKRSQPQFVEQWASTGRLNAHVEENYTGHALVKVYGQQQNSIDIFHAENDKLYQSSFKAQFISGIIQPAMSFVSNLNYVLIAVVGGLKVANGTMSLGDVQAFIQYSRQFSQPITQVASMMNLMQSGVASMERVFELLDADEQSADETEERLLPNVTGRIEFKNVEFSYKPDVPLITDLNLVAEPGQTIAIVGPTGAGKTTLVNLIMRFYEVNGGAITLDGMNIDRLSRDELRSNIGMVLQDTWLVHGTIEENIRYGTHEDVTEEQLLAATVATHVDPFVRTLPDGYQTKLTGETAGVSEGEKQLLTIARAFLSNPAILILDEATSSVDTRTEVLVQEAMNALRKGRTSFVIAHRLSTIRDADIILVMEHGDIVEQGNHDELLAAEGAYARLYRSQFAGAASS